MSKAFGGSPLTCSECFHDYTFAFSYNLRSQIVAFYIHLGR